MSSSLYDTRTIKRAVLDRYGSLIECAKALDISKQNLSSKLNTLTNKFIDELIDIGVNVGPPTKIRYKTKAGFTRVKDKTVLYSTSELEECRILNRMLQKENLRLLEELDEYKEQQSIDESNAEDFNSGE